MFKCPHTVKRVCVPCSVARWRCARPLRRVCGDGLLHNKEHVHMIVSTSHQNKSWCVRVFSFLDSLESEHRNDSRQGDTWGEFKRLWNKERTWYISNPHSSHVYVATCMSGRTSLTRVTIACTVTTTPQHLKTVLHHKFLHTSVIFHPVRTHPMPPLTAANRDKCSQPTTTTSTLDLIKRHPKNIGINSPIGGDVRRTTRCIHNKPQQTQRVSQD